LFGESRYEQITGERSPEFKYREPDQAFRLVKEMQPFDPTRPIPEFAYMVRRIIFKELKLSLEAQLRFYTSVESSLDRYRGIDGWFEIDNEDEEIRVTVDITKNTDAKDTGYKANIVFLVPDDGLDRKVDREQFIKYSLELAHEVVELFRQQGLSPERN